MQGRLFIKAWHIQNKANVFKWIKGTLAIWATETKSPEKTPWQV